MKNAKQVREDLRKKGITIREWSEINGFNPNAVSVVLLGKNKGHYGTAHKIAVMLGLKESVTTET
jgi:gp16 family phage-associated protein